MERKYYLVLSKLNIINTLFFLCIWKNFQERCREVIEYMIVHVIYYYIFEMKKK